MLPRTPRRSEPSLLGLSMGCQSAVQTCTLCFYSIYSQHYQKMSALMPKADAVQAPCSHVYDAKVLKY